MREILFRGKRVDNEKWVEGYLYHPFKKLNPLIMKKDKWESCDIDKNTIGQFTGLTDKNGVKIFEGDIIKINRFSNCYISKVVYNEKTLSFELWYTIVAGVYGEKATQQVKFCDCISFEIIGNIYDNPELLEGEKNE